MSPFSNPWILDGLGILLTAVGSAGLVALFISEPLRPLMKRFVAVTCPAMAIAGVLLMVRAEGLRDADRTLDPEQQAALVKAMRQIPNIRFEVFTAFADQETQALASQVVEAVKAATGAAPPVGTMPPLPQKGVVMVLHDNESDLARAVADKLGRVFMTARVAVITDDEPRLDDRTVRIIVGEKP